MKLVVNRAAFVNAVNLAGSAIQSRTPKPILQCLLMTAASGSLTVRGTDLELSIESRVDGVKVDAEGKVAVHFELLRNICRESSEDNVTLELKDDDLHVRTESSHFKLVTQNAKDYPVERTPDDARAVNLPLATLQQQIERTEFATAKEATRYSFNGTLFKLNGKFDCVATDGRRLAVSVVPLAEKLQKEISVIVPSKALNAVLRVALPKPKKDDKGQVVKEAGPMVQMLVTENYIRFVTDTVAIGTNLIEGTFPPYEDVIPKDSDKKAVLGRDALASALRRARLLTNNEMKGVRLSFSRKGLVITSRSPEAGESTIHLPCKYEGDDIEIGMNADYVVEGLKVIEQEEVSLELEMPNRPGVIKAADFQYVVMPLNLQ